jgi:hypothetical protein
MWTRDAQVFSFSLLGSIHHQTARYVLTGPNPLLRVARAGNIAGNRIAGSEPLS